MGKILQLPEEIAIKIAAGEVVERPASVVKELVENSLDAGATKIEISLVDGGRTKIEIRDNGSGMDKDDAEASFLRHGTSKIRSIDDLNNVTTLGFRGEALATIGATAEVTIETTQTDAPTGHKVVMTFGSLTPAKPNPPLQGTSISVTRLFESVPARLKFLKSDATEWKSCLEIITRQILCHPEVAFVVRHNAKTIFDLPVVSLLTERVAAVWSVPASSLVGLDEDIPHFHLAGALAKPELAHAGKARQLITVNGHPVNDKAIARAAKEAYGTLLPPGMQPSYVLHLTVHPGMVDVNIHPRKEEVRFINGQEVFRFVYQSVSQTLGKQSQSFERFTPSISVPQAPTTLPIEEIRPALPFVSRAVGSGAPAPSYLRPQSSVPRTGFHPLINPSMSAPAFVRPVAKPVICLDNCWLVTSHEGKLLVVDQHAAHERVLYNLLWKQDQERPAASQALLIPHPLNLASDEQAQLDEHQTDMMDLGFDFDSDNLRATPAGIKTAKPRQLFLDVLKSLGEERQEAELTTAKHRRYATLACKAAVKAGDVLSQIEMTQLIDDLLSDDGGFTCPHGRPTHIEVAPGELEKLFKRTGF